MKQVDKEELLIRLEENQKRKIIVGKGWAQPPYYHKATQKWVVEYWEQDEFINYPAAAVFDEQAPAKKYCKAIWNGDNNVLGASLTRRDDLF